jgi:hypothetical protein
VCCSFTVTDNSISLVVIADGNLIGKIHCILTINSAISSTAVSQKPGKSILPTRYADQCLKIFSTSKKDKMPCYCMNHL